MKNFNLTSDNSDAPLDKTSHIVPHLKALNSALQCLRLIWWKASMLNFILLLIGGQGHGNILKIYYLVENRLPI